MTLEEIQQKGNELSGLYTHLANAESRMRDLKDRIAKIEEEHLPLMMEEAGVTGIDLPGGHRIELKEMVFAKIPDTHKQRAFEWLEANGHDGIIKNEVKVSLSRGQNEEANRITQMLLDQGVPAQKSQTVHHQTLNAFVREVIETPDFPKETFGVREFQKVQFK